MTTFANIALVEPCGCKPGSFDVVYERSGLACMAHQPNLVAALAFARELGCDPIEVQRPECEAV